MSGRQTKYVVLCNASPFYNGIGNGIGRDWRYTPKAGNHRFDWQAYQNVNGIGVGLERDWAKMAREMNSFV